MTSSYRRGMATVLLALGCLSPLAEGATLSVTTTADAGAGSLRQAILDSNASVGVLDTIAFAIALGRADDHARLSRFRRSRIRSSSTERRSRASRGCRSWSSTGRPLRARG